MNYVVYHAYGNTEILCEAAYSMLTFFQHNSSDLASVFVYTDNPAFFKNIFSERVQCIDLTKATIQKWRGEIDFVHRVKIEMLHDFTSNHEGNILYLDTDTSIFSDLQLVFDSITNGNLFMHVNEGTLQSKSNPILRKTFQFVSHQAVLIDDRQVSIPVTTAMWNAGALGFNTAQSKLLDNVLQLTDLMYPLFPKHVVEQLAFSYYFQQTSNIQAAQPFIFHYWNFKEFRKVLREYFNAHTTSTFEQHLLNVGKINPQELVKPKEKFEKQNGLAKFYNKMIGRTWKFDNYKFW